MIELVGFDAARAHELVTLWRLAKARALAPFQERHSFEDHLRFLTDELAQRASITVALDTHSDRIAGFIALRDEWVDQLYLHPDYQRRGLGSNLIDLAKSCSPTRLILYTFQRNLPAQAFYLAHGFLEIGRGIAADEGLPDILFEWKGAAPTRAGT